MSEAASEVCNRVATAMLCTPIPGEGVTLWEAASAGAPFYPPGEEADPFSLMVRAAHGDVVAQREVAANALHLAMTGREDIEPVLVLAEGMMMARLAAVHGDPEDAMRLIVMLSLSSLLSVADAAAETAGEALARLELLADGDSKFAEAAAELLAACAERETPETLKWAQHFRARLVVLENV
jgi:hypothetical protein